MVVKYIYHGDDLVEHRTREASFGAQCTNHSANFMCTFVTKLQKLVRWLDGNNEEKKRITSDAISHR